jgi:hypothetical protein
MTGPQFQAKLPKRILDNEGSYTIILERIIWLNKLKSDLLSR